MILSATIPAQRWVQHINLHIMGMELCEECSYLTSEFSRGDLKEPPNYSFTCQLEKKKSLGLDLLCVQGLVFASWIQGSNVKINPRVI